MLRFILAGATAALMTAGAVQAATVTLTFSGEVENITNAAPVAVGQRVSGEIVVDDAAIGTPGGLTGTDYPITSVSLLFPSGLTDTFGDRGVASVNNDCTTFCVQTGTPAIDGFILGAFSSGSDIAALNFRTNTLTTLADESLTGVIDLFATGVVPAGTFLAQITTRPDQTTGLDRYGNTCTDRRGLSFCEFQLRIDSIGVAANDMTPVPLPAGLPLLLAGLGGLALLRRWG